MRAHKAIVALLLAAGAVSAAPADTGVTAGYQPLDKDERGLWMQVEEAERKLKASNFLIRDPALNAYVRGVFCRTVGDGNCRDVRVYLVRTPSFNAAMAPNGMMLINSGLFLRVRNEAQLAAVLGHEFTHYQQRHSLRLYRDIKDKTNAMAWLSMIPFGGLAAAGAISVAQLGILGSIYGFSREMEREADSGSVTMLAKAGYEPHAAARIWAQVRAEEEATAAERKRKKRSEGGLFASHPTSLDRMADLQKQADSLAGPNAAALGGREYAVAFGPFWADFIDDQIKLNDFGGTELLLSQLAADGWTPELLFARGELYRSRGKPEDFAKAAGFYREAIAGGAAPAEAHRGLGLALLRAGAAAEGQAALKDYLQRSPGAKDRAMVAMMAGVTG